MILKQDLEQDCPRWDWGRAGKSLHCHVVDLPLQVLAGGYSHCARHDGDLVPQHHGFNCPSSHACCPTVEGNYHHPVKVSAATRTKVSVLVIIPSPLSPGGLCSPFIPSPSPQTLLLNRSSSPPLLWLKWTSSSPLSGKLPPYLPHLLINPPHSYTAVSLGRLLSQ